MTIANGCAPCCNKKFRLSFGGWTFEVEWNEPILPKRPANQWIVRQFMGYSVGVELSTWQRARTKSTIALPSKRVDPVKMRSTATTTLCDIVSPIDSLTLAAIERMNRMIANTWQINLKQSNEMELRSSELMLTLGRSERCKLVAPLDPKPGKFKFKFMAPRFRFKLLPWIENGKGRGKREKKNQHHLQRCTADRQNSSHTETLKMISISTE